MLYVKLIDLNNPNTELYAIMTDDRSELLSVIDINCQASNLPTEHTFGEAIDTPPCVQ